MSSSEEPPPLPALKVPSELQFSVAEMEEKNLNIFLELEDPVNAPENLVIGFSLVSKYSTVAHTLQRRSNFGQGFLVSFIKRAKRGTEEILTLQMKESKMNSREKLTAGYFTGTREFTVKLLYKQPVSKSAVPALAHSTDDPYDGPLAHFGAQSILAKEIRQAVVDVHEKNFVSLGQKAFIDALEKLFEDRAEEKKMSPGCVAAVSAKLIAPIEKQKKSESAETVVFDDDVITESITE